MKNAVESLAHEVTVVIPTFNEQLNIRDCLRSVEHVFTHIVVLDSQSTDETTTIARMSEAEVITFHWNGQFPKKRNWLLRNYAFSTPWVLFLDADERVTDAFVGELSGLLADSPHVGFWLRYENIFLGSVLRYGDQMRKLALFRVGAGEYERVPVAMSIGMDMEIHEQPQLNGTTGIITSPLKHIDYKGLTHYIGKHNQYSAWEAAKVVVLANQEPSARQHMSQRQWLKYRYVDQWWFAWFYFLACYVAKLGFLDGWPGYVFAKMKKRYFEDIRLKILESRMKRGRYDVDITG